MNFKKTTPTIRFQNGGFDEGCVLYRLSKILDLDLGPLLIAEVLFSNVGGTATGNECVCVRV